MNFLKNYMITFCKILGEISGAATPSPWSLLTEGLYLLVPRLWKYYYSFLFYFCVKEYNNIMWLCILPRFAD